MKLEAGTLVDGRFEILSTIGSGGFSTVCLARQMQLDRIVALKILRPELLSESDSLPRFEREAKAISVLKHKNIVSVYAYGVWDQAPYMVLEHVAGESLQNVLYSNQPLAPSRVVGLMRQICEGLACAHAHGIIHRDLKPSNVLLMREPDGQETVKLIDFGLAKMLPGQGFDQQKLTEAGFAVGTAQYMSPEQCQGNELSPASDIYAAACIMYHCLTGVLPFDADSPVAVMYQHIHNQMPKLTALLPDTVAWRAYQGFLETAMDKDPKKRFQTGAQMSEALQQLPLPSDDVMVKPTIASFARESLTAFRWLFKFPLLPVTAASLLCLFLLLQAQQQPQEHSATYYKRAAELADLPGGHTSTHAEQAFKKALDLNKKDNMLNTWQIYDALAFLSQRELARFNYKQTEALCREALTMAGPSGTPRHEKFEIQDRLYQCMHMTGRNKEALQFCQSVRDERKDKRFQFQLRVVNGHIAEEAIITHDLPLAQQILSEERNAGNYPDVRAETFSSAGDTYTLASLYPEAQQAYDDCAGFEKHQVLSLRRARLALVHHRSTDADRYLKAWQTHNPPSAEMLMLQADSLLQQNKTADAEPMIRQACSLLTDKPEQRYIFAYFDGNLCIAELEKRLRPDLGQLIRGTLNTVYERSRLQLESSTASRTK